MMTMHDDPSGARDDPPVASRFESSARPAFEQLRCDDTVVHGYAEGESHVGGRLVMVEDPDGTPRRALPHIKRHSPAGFNWGYEGSGPADLARSLLVAALGEEARCDSCDGTTRVVWDDDQGRTVRYDPGYHNATLATSCDCGDGIGIPPAVYHAFKREYVARWDINGGWTLTIGEVRAWWAQHSPRAAGRST